MEPNKDHNQDLNNSESQEHYSDADASNNSDHQNQTTDNQEMNAQDEGTEEGYYSSPDDKYLALEQPGVTYTNDTDATVLLSSDDIEDNTTGDLDIWESDKKNSRNSEAFNQDEFLLNDNLEIDEEDNKSISSDDN